MNENSKTGNRKNTAWAVTLTAMIILLFVGTTTITNGKPERTRPKGL